MALLDIYGKEFIQAVSLILLCKNITTKSHQSHFEGPFANLLMVVSYSSVRFSRRATASGRGPLSPLACRNLLSKIDKQKRQEKYIKNSTKVKSLRTAFEAETRCQCIQEWFH